MPTCVHSQFSALILLCKLVESPYGGINQLEFLKFVQFSCERSNETWKITQLTYNTQNLDKLAELVNGHCALQKSVST